MIRKLFVFFTAIALVCSCGKKDEKKSYEEMGSNGMTSRTENLENNLKTSSEKGILVGQMYGTLHGVGWDGDSARSDINSICNDFPACNGYELAGLEKDGKVNVDGIAADLLRKDMLAMARRGCLILAKWTVPQFNDDEQLLSWTQNIAKFLDSVQDDYGKRAPIALMLLPIENDDLWYAKIDNTSYSALYKKIQDWLKNEGNVVNAFYGYSCHATEDPSQFMLFFPDAKVSIVNITCMVDDKIGYEKYSSIMTGMIPMLEEIRTSRGIPVGLTTGCKGIECDDFNERCLLPIMDKTKLTYIMYGENRGEPGEGNYYTPYPGSNGIKDFMLMYNDKRTLFAHEINGLYLNKTQNDE